MASVGAVVSCGGSAPDGFFDKEPYSFAKIILTGSSDSKSICGKVVIRPRLNHPRSKVTWENCPFYVYGITVELRARLSFNFGDKTRRFMFTPHFSSTTVYKSNIVTLVVGDEDGMRTGEIGFEPSFCLDSDDKFLPFTLGLPTNDQLPPSISNSHGKVEYFLVSYLRTTTGYEIIVEKPFTFYGHNIIHPQEECVPLLKEFNTEGVKVILSSPKKFYLPADKLHFNVLIHIEGKLEVSSAEIAVKLMRRVSFKSSNEEKHSEEMDGMTMKNVKKSWLSNEFNISGKLRLQPSSKIRRRSDTPVISTYNSTTEDGVSVRYILQCIVECGNPPVKTIVEEEVIVGSGRSGESVETSGSFAARFRSRSSSLGSSLLSLLPPAYSRLASRKTSTTSFETLPPHYNDLDTGGEEVPDLSKN